MIQPEGKKSTAEQRSHARPRLHILKQTKTPLSLIFDTYSRVYQKMRKESIMFKSSAGFVCNSYQKQHHRHLCQHTNRSSQRCRGCGAKQGDCNSDCQFKEIGCPDHTGGTAMRTICSGFSRMIFPWKEKIITSVRRRPMVVIPSNFLTKVFSK